MKKYSFDINWLVSNNFVIEANSQEEAYKILNDRLNAGEFSCHDYGWEATDDVEILPVGESELDEEIQYY